MPNTCICGAWATPGKPHADSCSYIEEADTPTNPNPVNAWMLANGFEQVPHVIRDGYVWAKHVDESPQHLTNGKSYWMLTANQAAEMYRMSEVRVDEAIDQARRHLYTASQVRQALGKVLGSKTAPKYVQAITDDVGEELTQLAATNPRKEA